MVIPSLAAEPDTFARRRVVVIEDEEAFLHTVQRSLELAGFEVLPFASAEAAADHLTTAAVSVVLTDLRLPGGDGLSVLDRVKAADPELPVVLMTGHGDIPTAIQAIRAGAYEFLEKPFSRERLLAIVTRAADRHTLLLENRQLKRQLAAASGISEVLRGDSAPRAPCPCRSHPAPTRPPAWEQAAAPGRAARAAARCRPEAPR